MKACLHECAAGFFCIDYILFLQGGHKCVLEMLKYNLNLLGDGNCYDWKNRV